MSITKSQPVQRTGFQLGIVASNALVPRRNIPEQLVNSISIKHQALLLVALLWIQSVYGTGIAASLPQVVQWHSPKAGVVWDGTTAIVVARAFMNSMEPTMHPPSKDQWLSAMVAELQGGIWVVSEKADTNDGIGGGLVISISKRDGRVLGMYLTQ